LSHSAVRDDLHTIISSVANVGTVHKYRRYSNQWPDFLVHFKTTIAGSDYIRGWDIHINGGPADEPVYGEWNPEDRAVVYRTFNAEIRGFFGVNDAAQSEITAYTIVENIINALNLSTVLHGGEDYSIRTPLCSHTFQEAYFGSTLCHLAIIQQSVVYGEKLT